MATVESPCVRNCCLNDDDICVGCYRSLAEISRWSVSDDGIKAQILAAVATRRVCHKLEVPTADKEK